MDDQSSRINRFHKATSERPIYTTADHERCRAMLPQVIEAMLAGEDVAALFPEVTIHLDTCRECDAEFSVLLDLATAYDTEQISEAAPQQSDSIWFLPAPTLAGYIGHIVDRLLSMFDFSASQEIKDLLTPFLARVRELGDSPLPRLASTLGENDDAIQFLAATHATTRLLRLEFSRAQIAAYHDNGTLAQFLTEQAKAAALDQGLPAAQADLFAANYAQIVSRDLDSLMLILIR